MTQNHIEPTGASKTLTLSRKTDKIEQGSRKWQMSFNASKCKTMRYGYGNPAIIYKSNGKEIESSSQKRDLAILIQEHLDWDAHQAKVTYQANRILGMIRSYEDTNVKSIVQLYKSLVRPYLEYAVQAWRRYKQNTFIKLKKYRDELQE